MPVTPRRIALGGLAALAALALTVGPVVGAGAVETPAQPATAASASTAPLSLAVLVPLTVRPTATGLIDSNTLAAYTAPLGVLTRQLDAVIGTPAVVGIDPMIIASIRVLGTSAPASALSWLERLRTSGNETFALAYADADLASLARVDALKLRAPSGFRFALDPKNFGPAVTATPTATPTASASPGPTPSPTPTGSTGPVSPPALPTDVDEVLDWSYSLQHIAWPADDTVVSDDISDLAAAGYQDVVLSSTNVSATDSALVDLVGMRGIVADAGVTSLVREVTYSSDPNGPQDSLSRLNSVLGGLAAVSPGRTVVATLDRKWPLGALDLHTLFADLQAQTAVDTVGLSQVLAGPHRDAKIADEPGDETRTDQLQSVVQASEQESRFATVATDPHAVTDPRRLALLALLAVSWLRGTDDWSSQVTTFLSESVTLRQSVQIVAGSDLVVGSGATNIPVTVSNASTVQVTVYVNVDSPRPALQVRAQNVPLTIEPGSSNKAAIPVAALTNDQVTTTVTIASVDGVPIGDPDYVSIDLHPGWESVGTTIVVVLLVLVFGGGLARNILKRRPRAERPPRRPRRQLLPRPPVTDSLDEGPSAGVDAADAAAAVTPARSLAGLGRASAALASGTLVSRLLGFVSAAVLAWTIGQQNQGANAFAIANQLPNNIYAIIAGGLLSAVLVPQIVRAARHDDGGQRFVNRLVTLGIVAFLAVTLLATLCAPLLVALYAGQGGSALQGDGVALAVSLAYWCLPQVFFYALYSLLGEVLNARGVFGPFTWAPVLNNVVAIAGIVVFAILYGIDPAHRDPSSWDAAKVGLLAGTATLGVAAQALILLVFWRRTGLGFRPDFRWRGVGLGTAGRAAAWTFGMILVTQLAGIVQSQVAVSAGVDDPSVAVLRTAWLIFMLPHGIVAVSIATPYFTRMSAHARDGRTDDLRDDLSTSLRTIMLLIVGAGVALAAAALPFAAFFAHDTREVIGIGGVLLAYLVGLAPFSTQFLVQRTFYALGDTRTPFFVQLLQSGLFVGGALTVLLLPPGSIAAGIAIVTSAAGTVQAIVAAALLRRRLGGIDGRRVLARFGVYALATIPAALVGLVALWALGGLGPIGLPTSGFAYANKAASLVSVAGIGGVTGLVYLGVLWFARVPELRALVKPLRRLLTRS